MKKLVKLLLCLCVLTALVLPTLAAESLTFTVKPSVETVHRGETVTLTVSVSGNVACTSFGFKLSNYETAFEVVSCTPGTIADANYFPQPDDKKDGFAFAYVDKKARVPSGVLGTITLKAKTDAAFKDISLTGRANAADNGAEVSCTVAGATIKVVCQHQFGEWTDTKDGLHHQHVCKICQESEKAAHTWDGGTVDKAPTCTTEGSKTFTCTVCGAKKTESIPVTEHNWKESVTKEPTCTEDGVKTITCSGCGESKTEPIPKLGHNWKESVTKEPTCTEDGVKTITCTRCGETKTESIPALGHDYKEEWSSDENGHFHECRRCGGRKDEHAHVPGPEATEEAPQVCTECGYIIQPAKGHVHEFSEEWSTAPSYHWHACSGCGEKKDYGEHVYDNACDPDCNVCGYQRVVSHTYEGKWQSDDTGHWYLCTVCGQKSEVYPHTFEKDPAHPDQEICTECGYIRSSGTHEHIHSGADQWVTNGAGHWHECKECGWKYDIASHVWDAGVVVMEPSEHEDGIRTFTCKVCGYKKTEAIPALSDGKSGEFPWWIVAVVVAVTAVGSGIFLLCGIIRGQRQVGRYSERLQAAEELDDIAQPEMPDEAETLTNEEPDLESEENSESDQE